MVNHVAIIMDGNGRWAKKRGLPRIFGHKKGLEVAQKIIEHCSNIGVKYLSLYVFSTENWKRPEVEVKGLFALADKYLDGFEDFCKNNVKIVVSGNLQQLPSSFTQKVLKIQQQTANFGGLCVNLCINYGGQAEIAYAANQVVAKGLPLTEQNIADNLYHSLPSPDLILRTGGQMRLSNFLLFQSAYAELFFCQTLWPDFTAQQLDQIIEQFFARTRNFGGIKDAK